MLRRAYDNKKTEKSPLMMSGRRLIQLGVAQKKTEEAQQETEKFFEGPGIKWDKANGNFNTKWGAFIAYLGEWWADQESGGERLCWLKRKRPLIRMMWMFF